MFGRIFNTILFLAFLGAAGYAGYKFFFENKGPHHPPVKAVPANAVAFLTGNNVIDFYREMDNTSLLWQDIKATGLIKKFDGQLDIWNTLDKKGEFKNLAEIPFVLSFHPGEHNGVDYMLCVSLLPNRSAAKIKKLLAHAGVSTTVHSGEIQLMKSATGITWYYYNYQNLLVFSPAAELVEMAVNECNNNPFPNKFAGFHQLKTSIGDHTKSSFFIRNAEFLTRIAPFFRSDLADMFTQYQTGVAGLYDVIMEPNAILLRGFNWAPDSVASQLGLLSDQQPLVPDLIRQLPENTGWFYFLGLSDIDKFTQRLYNQKEALANLEEFNGNYNVNLRQHLLSWVDGQIIYFNTTNFPDDRLLLLKADESKNALKEIEFLAAKLDSGNTQSMGFGSHIIRQLNESNLFGLVLGDVFSKIDKPYYMQLENSIVFSTSADALVDYVTAVESGRLLVRNVQFYDNLENHFSTATNVLFHTAFDKNHESWRLLDSASGYMLREVPFIQNMASFTFSLAHKNRGLFYTQALLKYKGSSSSTTNTIWDVSFDTLLQNTPHIIDNHLTGTKNIVIQDRANVLHSLSATGKTEFTVKLSEKIIGNITNVDIMKNGKNQLLFVTASKLHIVDLKGNYVSGFPVSLSAPATSAPAVFDYEGDGNYRVLIPSGKKILNYNKEGKPVTGFMFTGLPADITQPPVFARIDGKDYLFICDENGNIRLTDRKGNDRYPVKFSLRNRTANLVNFEKGTTVETSKIVYCTKNGTIYRQYMNGMRDSLPSKTQVKNGYGFIDMDDDGTSELVVVDSSKIKWFDFKGSLIKEIAPLCDNFQLQVFKAGHGMAVIGGTCKGDEMVTAFDNEGNDITRIRLVADSPFTVADINNDNKYEIIYCYRNRIFVYTLR